MVSPRDLGASNLGDVHVLSYLQREFKVSLDGLFFFLCGWDYGLELDTEYILSPPLPLRSNSTFLGLSTTYSVSTLRFS